MSKTDGWDAFPHASGYDFKVERVLTQDSGMTLRDYFAAKAMITLIHLLQFDGVESHIATAAYAIADAIIADRAKYTVEGDAQ
jgi:hypothetical protein